ncbi:MULTISPECIES: GTPase Era [Ruminococcus]|jgi:GTP-binding protein Era|uniref:GTPase Era n=2 Tax=Ruminococcus flavefaciens TaxID=1265 RepID=A0A315XVQ4_RUMFL|nr:MULTISPECIES: GTPase Era [Ruminococcus]MBQ6170325.1 GTPase Era [Ruminococcus sp.]MBR1433055.1 GTPase Era [Ruminococcus sp.]PWJ11266.1 GTP-binding protein Era [Ruminococcus flavefaciens]SSA50828.1 GTP-binding protein Era [Ruminococcus flavefaciens]
MSRTAFVTIAGRTNAGKSSLLNAIVGEKIASVSNKPQTTRTRITGIRNIDDVQLVFFDTPGLHKPVNKLSEHMLNTVKESVSDIDAVVFVMDCTKKINQQELDLLKSMNASKMPVILVLNKIDLLKNKDELAPVIADLTSKVQFQAVVPVSVTENSGVDIVIDEIIALSEESVHFFPDDMITDQPEKVLAAEMIREKLLMLLSEEVPHGIAVGVEQMSEREDKDILDISAVIYCEKESHKGIIIGKGGAMLKKASTAARIELEDFFQIKVNLKCWVKVKEDWRNRENLIRSFGLSEK